MITGRVAAKGLGSWMENAGAREGDAVCFAGKVEALAWLIARPQVRMLEDLPRRDRPHVPESGLAKWAKEFALYTHTGCYLSRNEVGEMYRPKARTRRWDSIPPGTRVLVRRPVGLDPMEGQLVARACLRDVEAGLDYPVRELLTYYLWSWRVQKLWLGRKAVDVFRDSKTDTCAARYLFWAKSVPGRFVDDSPELWYPARIAADGRRFETVCEAEVR